MNMTWIHYNVVCWISHFNIRILPYSGKLLREKTFVNFEVLWLFAKVFSAKFGDVVSFGGTSEQSTKVFSVKMFFPPICESFLPQKFLTVRYLGVYDVICYVVYHSLLLYTKQQRRATWRLWNTLWTMVLMWTALIITRFVIFMSVWVHYNCVYEKLRILCGPRPLINKHAIVSTISCHAPAQSPSSLPCQKSTPYKVRVVFSKPVHAVRAGGGPPGPNQPSLAATMCTVPCRWPHSRPPVPPPLMGFKRV